MFFSKKPSILCPCCSHKEAHIVKETGSYKYYKCGSCESIYINPSVIEQMDKGVSLIKYTDDYWNSELPSAKQRSYGPALARMAECFYYARIPINKFIDIGTGPGYFLDAVKKYLPNNEHVFYGVEKFPPPAEYMTESENYIIGDINETNHKFDAGICVEVIEHVTPNMFKGILEGLAKTSNPGAFYIFNTGMPDYVLHEDMDYLDPFTRGHIVSYSLKAIEVLSRDFGFTPFAIKGKSWAFGLEYKSQSNQKENIQDRIWSALPHNLNILSDKDMGEVLKVLGLDTARAYG
jgi:hypothetical protein